MTRLQSWYCAVAIGGSLLAACGGDDDAATPKKVAGTGGGAGRAGSSTGQAGANVITADTPTITDLVDMINMLLTPMCDASAVSEASCGGVDCPALADDASATCTINCCTPEQKCGTRIADTRVQQILGMQCVAPVEPDTRCPSAALAGQMLAGCCDTQGNCGQVFGPLCLPGATPRRCDGSSVSDGGI